MARQSIKKLLVEGEEDQRVIPPLIEANGIRWGEPDEKPIVDIGQCGGFENLVGPGLIETDILEGVDQAKLDVLIAATPLQRIGRPDEIAPLVLFLLTEKSSFMTGQTLVASGGRVLLP